MKALLLASALTLFTVILYIAETKPTEPPFDYEYKLKQQDSLIKIQDSIIIASYNSVVRMEIYLGVKEPDGVVEYKEKLLTGSRNILALNRRDLRGLDK